jgi:hypothetical protein
MVKVCGCPVQAGVGNGNTLPEPRISRLPLRWKTPRARRRS